MATSHDTRTPKLSVSCLDGINDLNNRLEAFQLMHYAFLNESLREGGSRNSEAIAGGIHDIIGDMLLGYQRIAGQIDGLMSAYRAAGFDEVSDHE